MRLLLDTHAFIWYVLDSPQLTDAAAQLIEDPGNRVEVSMARVWEMAIKVSIGKLTLNRPFPQIKTALIDGNGFRLLPVEYEHTVIVSSLPQHHRDPFDRLLVAQSLADGIPLVSADAALDAYGLTRYW